MEVRNSEWFKNELAPKLKGYELDYKFFAEGDFGSLDQVEFSSIKKGGNIDFSGLGWFGVFVWDYEKEEQLLNVLLEPDQEKEKEEVLKKMLEFLYL